MGEKSDQLERHIHEQRNELGENIHELQEKVRNSVDKVKNSVDWRVQFQERPMTLIGIAFAGGLAASALFGRRRNTDYTSAPSTDRWNNANRWNTEGRSDDSSKGPTKDWRKKTDNGWEDIKGAVIGLAATKAGSALEKILPGFQEHYQRRQEERRSGSNGSAERDATWPARTASDTSNAGYPRQS
jgi:hypothetical protein